MARTTATNFSGGLQFPYATAGADLFKKEDVQTLAQAVDQHTHDGVGKGLAIADGTITTAKIAIGAVSGLYTAVGLTANPQTSSSSLVDMPDMAAVITTLAGSGLLIWGAASMNSNNIGGALNLAIAYDGSVLGNSQSQVSAPAVGYSGALAVMALIIGVTAGNHDIRLRWGTGASNTITAISVLRTLMIMEVKR